MVRVDVGRVVVLGALTAIVAAGHQQLWILYVVAFTLGVGETLHDTAAQSVLPNVVGPDDLGRANSRQYAVELSANQFVGPPLGGLLAAATLAGALASSVVGYALAAVSLTLLVGTFRPIRTGAPTTLRADIAVGVRYLAGHRLLRSLAVCVGLNNLASTAMLAVFPLYVVRPGPVGLTGAGYGLLLTGFAAGALLGTFFVEPVESRIGRRRALLVAAASFPIVSLVPALSTDALVIGASFVVASALSVGWNIITVSLRQRIVPDHLLGRVNAGYRLLAWGTMPLGAALGGVIGARYGVVSVFWTSTALNALCLPLLLTQLGDAGVSAERKLEAVAV
jgi:MFS family permease